MKKFMTIALFFTSGCSYIDKIPQDSFLEEIAEEIIEYKYGISVDLSPFSSEE